MADVEDKLTPIQSFLGPLFPLLAEEKIAILFGLTNVQLKLENTCNNATDFNARSLGYSTARLRECGEQLFQSCWFKTTTFDNERYLSMLQQDIIYDINQFEPSSEVLVEFMKRQTMYQNIQSYRGAMKYGPIEDYEEYLQAKQNLQNITAVGSFYTLIGICWIKFGKEATAKQLIGNKIINGPNGLIRLTTQLSRT
ncbi:uncharacterized protein KQ657_004579 [Scheffersomyces spartinae]|uniref:Uncharacterized protein n=1 Tax=Scheffersomyces spartinae TaxID=45513 RepID=A0A9P7VAK1_9ASCO|nr:uncharacterized protein KQ657_004579 [Scheffersomyces spartinae]KAG7194367.1 hypothetical protein KQ657_004579 [Scheffersomyces spartinae]